MLGLNAHIDTKKLTFIGVLVSLGIVFGDIGTSPLYVMKAIVNARKESGTLDPIFLEGALSCIIWTLTIQTTIKYVLILSGLIIKVRVVFWHFFHW